MVRQRVRIRFRKQGDLRWIGHRDLVRTLERLFRRAQLKLRMSEGFHPRPRMSFPSALGVGIAALDEVMELELAETPHADDLLRRLQEHTVPGLEFAGVEVLAANEPKGQVVSVTFECPLPEHRRDELSCAIGDFLAEDSRLVYRPGRDQPVDVRRDVRQIELLDNCVRLQMAVTRDASARPQEVLAAIGLNPVDEGDYFTRSAVQLASEVIP